MNVTFKPRVLKALDGYASEHHLTRAAALETAVRAMAMSADPHARGRVRVYAAR